VKRINWEAVPCPYCGAGVGQRCVRKGTTHLFLLGVHPSRTAEVKKSA
jgi:hypothetical protein